MINAAHFRGWNGINSVSRAWSVFGGFQVASLFASEFQELNSELDYFLADPREFTTITIQIPKSAKISHCCTTPYRVNFNYLDQLEAELICDKLRQHRIVSSSRVINWTGEPKIQKPLDIDCEHEIPTFPE